ncbi:aromatic amino acid aminotransferase [Neohortaea acidophila]|uniref:Aromatic amino acid aminotransferase n=1 Tax=Neohortaea acidophila TaxID=245834 RepID=A0A6A6PVQ9_9PEZI|nr:aromatic amino acid aminotransferase [Neohortaea acidophila]KAF2484258.1 aromatic amino acid aminotransferase [Neohortaea acidophila]
MLQHKLSEFAQRQSTQGCIKSPEASPNGSTRIQPAKPHAKNWDHHFSLEASSRRVSTLKSSAKTPQADVISLGVGRPASEFYPWQSMIMPGATDSHGTRTEANQGDAALPMICTQGESAFDLRTALDYGPSKGLAPLLRFVHQHTKLMHNPQYINWDVSLTCGATSAIEILLRMLCDRGDSILMEEYTYTGAMEAARPLGLNLVGVEMDRDGLDPVALDKRLLQWDVASGPKPKVLYLVPCGQNPTGITQPEERRRAIYAVVERHDLIIIEDDPYYFIRLSGPFHHADTTEKQHVTADKYLTDLPLSYLSLDTSGRVLRLDSTSKIIAPGLRCGWISGCSQLIAAFTAHSDFSTMGASGPSQVMLYKLLVERWGHEGFFQWLMHQSRRYNERLNTTLDACRRYLPIEICNWTVPECGMFLWVEVDWKKHPKARREGVGIDSALQVSIEGSVHARAREEGVLVSSGSWFAVSKTNQDRTYFRLTFAAAPGHKLSRAVECFGNAVRKEFLKKRS